MFFPALWGEDSLVFDDSTDREKLIRQFDLTMEGKTECDETKASTNPNMSPFDAEESSTVSGKETPSTQPDMLTSMFCESYGLSGRPVLASDQPISISLSIHEPFLRTSDDSQSLRPPTAAAACRGLDGTHAAQSLMPSSVTLTNDETRTSSSQSLSSSSSPAKAMSQSCIGGCATDLVGSSEGECQDHFPKVPQNHDFVAIVKLSDGHYYMATKESPLRVPRQDKSAGVEASRPSTGNRLSLDVQVANDKSNVTQAVSCSLTGQTNLKRKHGCLTPKRLFPLGPDHANNSTTKLKTSRMHKSNFNSEIPRPPNYIVPETPVDFPNTGKVPQPLFEDLQVIRCHRRSSYADGDSLVEVQPASLPGSPTMFAYRDQFGGIRVPLNMQCNQKALATYRNLTPSAKRAKNNFVLPGNVPDYEHL